MSRSVLVVDDDQAIRDTLCELLGDEGYHAIGAANGQEALDLLRSSSAPCVILLDLMMPIMDGAAFRARQLQDAQLRLIPVAVITAAGANAVPPSMNVNVILPKPLRIDSILQVIDRLCPA
jgi:CheY-like chemotaxis protein